MTESGQARSRVPVRGASLTGERVRLAAGVLLTQAVAWAAPLRQISPDTKTDLYLDPIRFMSRALHLWDPQVTWGVMQNQGYGYLFPMGPFFAAVGSVVPMWVAQRLWWSLLLLAGYLGMLWLLRGLGLRAGAGAHLGALAYALAPRVITTLGGISSESQPVLLAPLILAPLVFATSGHMAPRKAAALSGLAILACGGVNATATLLVIVPAGVWLITRSRWWRRPITGWWTVAVVCATAWWVVPLLLLGRYSPPFLDWIENARMVSAPVGLLDIARGTTHWLGHLLTAQGPWWPAGYALVSDPWVILATALIAALGLAGLAVRVPHRGFLLLLLVIGVLVLAIPHSGSLGSPLAGTAQTLLDGALSPLRNVHKADPLVRLPVCVGLAYALTRGQAALPRRVGPLLPGRLREQRHLLPGALVGLVGVSVVWAASPAIDGHLTPRGTFTAISEPWQDAADWLTENADGHRSLIVPAGQFAEYTWGRPLDEPLRSLSDADYAIRDAVPLTPANTVRFLDAVEQGLQSGRQIEDATAALARLGVKYLVLRNDLDTVAAGGPPVFFADSAIRSTPSLTRVARFGTPVRDLTGVSVSAVEIYEIDHPVADAIELWPATSVVAASGASESLPELVAQGGVRGPVIFDGDRVPGLTPEERIETDSYRARERFFGVARGQDVTSALTASEDDGTPDYRPWSDESLRSTVEVLGVKDLWASSSIATEQTLVGVRPAYRPFAAVDGEATTGWLTFGDERPTLRIELEQPLSPEGLAVTPFAEDRPFAHSLGVATRIRVMTDDGSVEHEIDPRGGTQSVPGLGETTSFIEVVILDTTRGVPASTLTGLSELSLPGITVRERIRTAPGTDGRTQRVLVGTGETGSADGCLSAQDMLRCVSGQFRPDEATKELDRSVSVRGEGQFTLAGGLVANPLTPLAGVLHAPEIAEVSASSVRALGPAGAPSAPFDLDGRTAWSPAADDPAPRITATFSEPVTVDGVTVRTRDRWTERHPAFVRVVVDGFESVGRLTGSGEMFFEPMTGRTISVVFVREASGGRFASLEVESVSFRGVALTPPSPLIEKSCGEGPMLRVNDVEVPTQLAGTRDAALGFGTMGWLSCAPVGLGYLPTDTVSVQAWEGMTPSNMLLTRAENEPAPESVAASARPSEITGLTRSSPTLFTGELRGDEERILVMTDNANVGWQGTLAGQPLTPVTVDGFRQGFIVPAGASGELTVRFGPDGIYRVSLAAGFALALLLLPMLLRTGRPSAPLMEMTIPPPLSTPRGRLYAEVSAVVLGIIVAGPVGGVVALVVVLALRVRRLGRHSAELVVALVLVAGLVAAFGSAVATAQSLEIATRILVLLALVVVVAQPNATQAPPRANS